MNKNIIISICFIIIPFVVFSKDKIDLTSPEKTIQYFVQMDKSDTEIKEQIFTKDYNSTSDKFKYDEYNNDYEIVKIFKSDNGPGNLYISLVKVDSDGHHYYVLYLYKENSQYLIGDYDNVYLPNPEDLPNIEDTIISRLAKNYKTFKTK